MQFYLNKNNGEIIVTQNSAINDDNFQLIKVNDTDAAKEKHVPIVDVKGNVVTVTIGSILHPMTEKHLISHVFLETNRGFQMKRLSHEEQPIADFTLTGDEKTIAAYEYCNLHGLWVSKI